MLCPFTAEKFARVSVFPSPVTITFWKTHLLPTRPASQPAAFEWKRQTRLGFRLRVRREGKPGNQATTVQPDLHIEGVLFKLREDDHPLADGLRFAELLDFPHLLCQPLEELA